MSPDVQGFCEYLAAAHPQRRLIFLPSAEAWASIRLFCRDRLQAREVGVSGLLAGMDRIPAPDEIRRRLDGELSGLPEKTPAVVTDLHGCLDLLDSEGGGRLFMMLRQWMDDPADRECLCLLRSDHAGLGREIFQNPRYRESLRWVEIGSDAGGDAEAAPASVILLDSGLLPFAPAEWEKAGTFQEQMRHAAEHPFDTAACRLVASLGGRPLAGLKDAIRQVVALEDLADMCYGVPKGELEPDALRRLCGRARMHPGREPADLLMDAFFRDGDIGLRFPRVFQQRPEDRGLLLWLARRRAPANSYLRFVLDGWEKGKDTDGFLSAYAGAMGACLERREWAGERAAALRDVNLSGIDHLSPCRDLPTSQVAPWLCCGMPGEKEDLLRRCAADGAVSPAVLEVFPELEDYLSSESVFGDEELESYFAECRRLCVLGRSTPEFSRRVRTFSLPSSIRSRNDLLQEHAQDGQCALVIVDAMGADWLPMLLASARRRAMPVLKATAARAILPTSTRFNPIPEQWRERCSKLHPLDNIAHDGAEAHEARSDEENLAAALAVVGKVLDAVRSRLQACDQVIVTADHGSSRLALLAWRTDPPCADRLSCEDGAEPEDARWRSRPERIVCPPELEEDQAGRYWVVRGHDRLPRKGGSGRFAVHGGGTPEERLVPFVVFSRPGGAASPLRTPSPSAPRPALELSAPKPKPQIVEDPDFDL